MSFGDRELEGWDRILGFFMELLFRPNADTTRKIRAFEESLELPKAFDAMDIRRGCAIGRDEVCFPARDYLQPLMPLPPERCLFLMTDDYEALEQVQKLLQGQPTPVRLMSLSEPCDSGFDPDHWQSCQPAALVKAVAEVSIALHARHLVSTESSAPGRAVRLMSARPEWCRLLRSSSMERQPVPEPGIPGRRCRLHLTLTGGVSFEQTIEPDRELGIVLGSLQRGGRVEPLTDDQRLLQIPLDSGQRALSLHSSQIRHLRMIREREPAPLQSPRPLRGRMTGRLRRLHRELRQQQDNQRARWAAWVTRKHLFPPDSGFLEWLVRDHQPESVLLLGCDTAAMARFFTQSGCRVESAGPDAFSERPLKVSSPFDLVWICDLLEYVERRHSHHVLATLSAANGLLMITTASARQSPRKPVNVQPRSFWLDKLNRLGFSRVENRERQARKEAGDHRFARNGVVLERRRALPEQPVSAAAQSGPDERPQQVDPLPINSMPASIINGRDFHVFFDLFVHPSRSKLVAVVPCYHRHWNPDEQGIDLQQVWLETAGIRVRGRLIEHRLNSWEPCSLLDFESDELAGRLRASAKIEVVVTAGSLQQSFTVSTLPPPPRNVVMSLVIKDENRWLRSFLEYYLRCLGVDHVLVYDNGTDDRNELMKILRPYRDAGEVTYIYWPFRWRNDRPRNTMIAQPAQEAHSLNRFANARWIGFLDIDEYLRIPGRTLPDFLADYEDSDVDGLSFYLRWFSYRGSLSFDEIIDAPLTFRHSSPEPGSRQRQKFIVSPRRSRFLRLHYIEDGGRELVVDDTDIHFHHYYLRRRRFDRPPKHLGHQDSHMLQFSEQLSLDAQPGRPVPRPRSANEWIAHICASIAMAEIGRSGLNESALKIDGMCGSMTRHFYNNMCRFEGCRYLEVGSLHGASMVAACLGNDVDAVSVDNFSQFRGQRERFERAIRRFDLDERVRLIEGDLFEVDESQLGPFDVFLYDGPHARELQRGGIRKFAGTLDKPAVMIVDDWNWPHVRQGTVAALRDLEARVLYRKEIRLPADEVSDMPRHRGRESWWNGICILLLESC